MVCQRSNTKLRSGFITFMSLSFNRHPLKFVAGHHSFAGRFVSPDLMIHSIDPLVTYYNSLDLLQLHLIYFTLTFQHLRWHFFTNMLERIVYHFLK